ncbi:MAG: helix-turn-helix domain-containing protein [Clostridiales bacterium]|nr:helix-turn-helix domain-containing protein [Clostridiales bacterium]
MEQEKKKLELQTEQLKQYGNLFQVSERKELIGEMLRVLRQASGLTQAEIAKKIDVKPVTYSSYENGAREAPAEIIVRLSILFGVPTDVILQADRLSKGNFDAQKQIDVMNNQLDELKDIITDRKNEINPQFADMMKAMTDAFSKMGEQFTEFNNNNKKG